MNIFCKIGIHKWSKTYDNLLTTLKCKRCNRRLQQEYYEFGLSSDWKDIGVDIDDKRNSSINEILG